MVRYSVKSGAVKKQVNNSNSYGIKLRCWSAMASITLVGCFFLFVHHAAGQVLGSENEIDEGNRRVVLVGSKLQLRCTPPDADEILDYFTWSKNGVLIPDRYSSTALQSRFIIQSDFSLLIERVADDDEGNYSCTVQSQPPRTTNYTVQVEVPATIEELLHDGGSPQHHLREGGDLDLVCLATGRPLPTVTWKYQDKVLSAEESIVDINQKVKSVHRIVNARRIDAGPYICEADNGVDSPATATFTVEVAYAPEIVVEQSWVHTGLGSLTELACTVYAQPPAQMTWFRSSESGNGERQQDQVIPTSRIGILVVANGVKHVLRFKSVRDADLGIYTCRAENSLGRAEAAIEMSGKAMAAVLWVSPPRDNSELVDHNGKRRITYRLTWDAVSQSPIYEYRLWLRPRGQPETSWINLIIPSNSSQGSSSSLHSHGYELSDLATGVVYQISVQSRNRFGWSAESNTVFLSGGEDPELDYDTTEDKISSSSTTSFTMTSTTSTTTTTTLTPTMAPTMAPTSPLMSSSTVVDSSVTTVQLETEVTNPTDTISSLSTDNEQTDDNQSTLPALVIDPESVQQHGTHQELQTTTIDPPTQAVSQSTVADLTSGTDPCQSGGDCGGENTSTSKDPANLPSSIVAPGNSVSRPKIRDLSIIFSVGVVAVISAVFSKTD